MKIHTRARIHQGRNREKKTFKYSVQEFVWVVVVVVVLVVVVVVVLVVDLCA